MVEKGKAFRIFSNVLMILIGICSIAPFLLLIMSSVTDEQSLVSNGYSFFPKEYSLYAYKYLLADSTSMVRAYGISILVTAVGTVANLLLTTLYATRSLGKICPAGISLPFTCSLPCCSLAA